MAKLAENLVRNCLRIRPDDNVTVFFYPHTKDLAEDIAIECFKVGADALLNLYTDRYWEAYMKHLSVESLRQPSVFCRGLTELSSAEFWIGAAYDPAIFRRVPAEKMAANDEGETNAHWPLARDRKVRSLSLSLGLVTRPRAKAYGYSFPAWRKMVLEASAVRADRLREDGKRVAGILGNADRVRLTAKGTDLEFSLVGRKPFVYDGVVDDEDIAAGAFGADIPAGQVAVPVVETSATGTVTFGVPQAWAGRTIRRLRLELRDGRVTSWEGDAAALALRKQWELATGDKDRLGMVGVGLNPRARLGFLQNPIVRGAVSLAVGSNEGMGGQNKSTFYYEQTLGDATLEADGREVVKAGRLAA